MTKWVIQGGAFIALTNNLSLSSNPSNISFNSFTNISFTFYILQIQTPYFGLSFSRPQAGQVQLNIRFTLLFLSHTLTVQTRLTVENDDKASMYSVKDLMYIHERIGIPIVFDYHHHSFCTGDLSEEEALNLAVSTWGDIKPVVHYSESKALNENLNVKPQAHSDYIKEIPNTYGLDVDIMVEAKAKELSILEYIQAKA